MTTVFASLDGSFGFVRPLTEKSYRRLHFLQTFIGSVTPQIAGLHIKGSRSAKPSQPIVNGRNARNLIDGDVVEQYLHLSLYDKTDLARRLGVGRCENWKKTCRQKSVGKIMKNSRKMTEIRIFIFLV